MADVTAPTDWGTIPQAAERLSVSVKTIRRMITAGQIEARRFGPRLIRVNIATLANAGRSLTYGGGSREH